MAYAPQRSMNGNLSVGMTEGTFTRRVRDRGGYVEDTTAEARSTLYDKNYGIVESPVKPMPDGTERYGTGDVTYRNMTRHQG